MRKDQTEGLSFAVPMPLICTVLKLLRDGLDPSPPIRAIDFAVDENDEKTLVVARSRLPEGSVRLEAGDEIVGAGPQTVRVVTESEVVDQLRGTLDDVRLRILRNGKELLIHGRWPAVPLVTQRRALWINGAMFADSQPELSALVSGSPALMVHHVEPGSEAEGSEIAAFDMLMSADGQRVDSLDALENVARLAAKEDRDIELVLLRLAERDQRDLFVHQRRRLTPADTERIGPAESRTANAR
jgi:hypothetical protein